MYVDLSIFLWKSAIYHSINPVWHYMWKQEKCSSLELSRGNSYTAQWAGQGLKITRLMSIFTSIKVWKFLVKILIQKGQGVENALPHANVLPNFIFLIHWQIQLTFNFMFVCYPLILNSIIAYLPLKYSIKFIISR